MSKRVIAEEVRSTSARELEKRALRARAELPEGDDHRVGYQQKREQQGAVAPSRYQIDHGFLHFYRPQLYISVSREWLPQVSKPGNSTHSVLRYVSSTCTVTEHADLGELKPAARAAGLTSGSYATLPLP
jgi:hypothetical protein